MRYPTELIEEVRMQNDIVDVVSQYIPLKQKGSAYFGLCPFHHEKSPSFCVNSDKQFYYCFGCGASGNVYGFLMEMERYSFLEALEYLADRVHITLPQPQETPQEIARQQQKNRLFAIHKAAGRFYYDMLHSETGTQARVYMQQRNMQHNIAKKFGIGYAPNQRHILQDTLQKQGYTIQELLDSGLVIKNKEGDGYHDRFRDRLMFPIFDAQARVVGFGGRILHTGEPKYLNSPETILFHKSRNLYGLHLAKSSRKTEFILVEGYMDLFSLYQAGFHNVVATLGTACNQDHARVLKKYVNTIILLYDSDDAGTNAALRAIKVLVENGLQVKVLQVPNGKDPDEFLQENGSQEFAKLLVQAVHHITFEIACLQKQYHLEIPEQRVAFTTKAATILSQLENDIEREVYIEEVSRITNIAQTAIKNEIAKQKQQTQQRFEQSTQQRIYQQRQYTPQQEKGVLDAQKSLLYLCTRQKSIYEIVQSMVTKQEFPTKVYAQAYEYIGNLWESEGNVFAAQLLNFFEDADAQREITQIFAQQPLEHGTYDLQKTLQEAVYYLKKKNIEHQMVCAETIEELQALQEQRKKLETLHIPM